ncbi:MAG: hypothetical protein JSR65_14185 [Proteobacteria bacterium]|nr:hypothetical protein [Pseudomonadota bacterium]
MATPEALRARLRAAWARNARDWLHGGGNWPLTCSTHPPTQAQAVANWPAFDAWLRQWRESPGAGEVERQTRDWPLLGAQTIPVRWRFSAPADVADALGEGRRWRVARARYDALVAQYAFCTALSRAVSRQFDLLADLPDAEFARLNDVLRWLHAHPDSGLYLRQLPIAGVHSKWIEPYRGVLAAWLATLRGADSTDGLYAVAGLRPMPDRIRLRVLDATLRARLGGVGDIEAPLEQLAALSLPVRCAFIVENLATGLAFGDLPGAIVFMARGYAVDAFAALPLLKGASVLYWGDLDTNGFAILDRLRVYLPQARSLLMDEATLLRFRELWVEEDKPALARDLPRLTADEADVCKKLRTRVYAGAVAQVRLEQERIAWDWAWRQIVRFVRD